jgi:hypothetical protein
MGNLLYAVKRSDVVQGVNAWRQATVKAEYLIIDKGCEVLPDVRVAVFAEAFVVESVHLSDLAGFVVSSEDGNALRVADFEGNKEGDGFD